MKKQKCSHRPLRAGLISLGCAKNLVDAEIMLGALLKDGVDITNQTEQADVLIVNTCSFIDAAQEESVDTILESAEFRDARNRGQAIVVAGCLPQRFRAKLPALLPEVDAFMGIDQVPLVGDIVRQAIERRRGKDRIPKLQIRKKSAVQSSKPSVATRLAELERDRPGSADATSPSLRGTDKFGRTRTVVVPSTPHATHNTLLSPPSILPSPSSPILDVHVRPTYIPDYATPRFRLTPRHLAYVKIAEGCNHPCSFCIIPQIRGAHRSRPQADIVEEARRLIGTGVKELNLISQDSTYYGLDLRPNRAQGAASPEKFALAVRALPAGTPTICTLLREISALPGEFWIRLLYTHPAHWTDELIQTLAECSKVARYVDIPLQHIHENMLERMRRETSQQYIVDLIHKIRAGIPGISLRTTFIVGFPGETEACFQSLLDFIQETKFERLGVFTYSQETGTRAGRMSGQIPDKVKQQRRECVMAEQRKITRRVSESFAGQTLKVLVEGETSAKQLQSANVSSWEHGLIRLRGTRNADLGTGKLLVARGEADAPDIDGRVYVRGRLPIGEFAQVKVIGHTDYDLIAEPATSR